MAQKDNRKLLRWRHCFFGALLLVSWQIFAHAADSTTGDSTPPEFILDKAAEHLSSRLSSEFYLTSVHLDPSKTEYHESCPSCDRDTSNCGDYMLRPHYHLWYSLRIPERQFVAGAFHCVVDSQGALQFLRGVPDCVSYPEECQFPIDREDARRIATFAGLKSGTREWSLSCYWNHGYRTFVWGVENTLHEKDDYANGELMLIDANSGDVHITLEWISVP